MEFRRLLNLPLENQSSIFLFGPRGTGKTSWLKSHLPNAIYIDLLDLSVYGMLNANPHRINEFIPPNYKDWVIIDEVQRIPELLNEVHRLIESKKIRFILTGSSARKLRQNGVNLLAGRALLYYMHPLTIQEIGEQFDVAKVLKYGLLPKAVTLEDPIKYLTSYAQVYVKEEVAQERLVRNIGLFSNFLEVASFSQGEILNMAEIGRELGIQRHLVSSYFSILDDLLLSIRLNSFTRRAKRKMVARQKFYYFDVGIYRAIRPKGPLDTPDEIEGAGLETLFLQSVRALNDYFNLGYDIKFWRTSAGDEVDFVLYGERGFHAFEIKRTRQITPKMLKGLKKFHEDYPEAKLHIFYGGNHQLYYGPITAYPFVEGLKKLPDILR